MLNYVVLFMSNEARLTPLMAFNVIIGIYHSMDEACKETIKCFENDEFLIEMSFSDTRGYIETNYGSYKIEGV